VIEPASADALSSTAEAVIVGLARLGDRGAFEELVRRRQSFIRSLLRRLCRNPALADDLAQETFLQAWKQIRALRSAGAFGGWLRQIAVNAWLQHARGSEPFTELIDDPHAGTSPTINEQLDLDGALSALHPVARLCVVLSYHEGMSHGEIASVTQLPLGTVKSHITRGTSRLRELLVAYDSSHERRTHAQ
jgi:RNA polymerase sigma-70 factor (ECF subfamily)